MGNAQAFYREKPLKDYISFYGCSPYFKYVGNSITGWRKAQEDKMACHLNFFGELSFFAVYDGHGGGEVSEYLRQNYHNNLFKFLEESGGTDVETALYLSFLSTDLSLRNLSQEELDPIKDAIAKTFKLDDQSTISTKPEFKYAVTTELINFFQDKSFEGPDEKGSSSCKPIIPTTVAKSLIASSETMQKLFIEPIEDDDDDDDEDYVIQEEKMESDSSTESTVDGEKIAVEDLDSMAVDSSSNESTVDGEKNAVEVLDSMAVDSSEPTVAKGTIKDFSENCIDGCTELALAKTCDKDCNTSVRMSNLDQSNNTTCSTNAEKKDSNVSEEKIPDGVNESSDFKVDDLDGDNSKPLVGLSCGSTASVLIISKEKAFVANVGDSRCVACVKGQAVELTQDHIPTDKEELSRIINSGSQVIDGRIDGGLNMSRAFGDFGLKKSVSQEPIDTLICHPYINTIDINEDLEFIILASDGIWNSGLSSQEIINCIREQQKSIEDSVDICAELFEMIIASSLTEDGSGCDNMSAIIIFFEEMKITNCIQKEEKIKYFYPKKSDKETEAVCNDNSKAKKEINKN